MPTRRTSWANEVSQAHVQFPGYSAKLWALERVQCNPRSPFQLLKPIFCLTFNRLDTGQYGQYWLIHMA